MNESYQDLNELIERLEKIKSDGEGHLSFPKALYILALEIKKIKNELHNPFGVP